MNGLFKNQFSRNKRRPLSNSLNRGNYLSDEESDFAKTYGKIKSNKVNIKPNLAVSSPK